MKVTYDGFMSFGTKTGQVDVLTPSQFRSLLLSQYAPASAQAQLMGTASTDWQNQIYQTAFSLDHNLNISGAVKNFPYRASVGYSDQTGLLKTSGLQRFTAAVNLNPSYLVIPDSNCQCKIHE